MTPDQVSMKCPVCGHLSDVGNGHYLLCAELQAAWGCANDRGKALEAAGARLAELEARAEDYPALFEKWSAAEAVVNAARIYDLDAMNAALLALDGPCVHCQHALHGDRECVVCECGCVDERDRSAEESDFIEGAGLVPPHDVR